MFTQLEVLDSIYHQFFFAANFLGCQAIPSHCFEPIAPQTSKQVDTATFCILSEVATQKKDNIMLFHNQLRCAFCSSLVIHNVGEAITVIHTLVRQFIPLQPHHCFLIILCLNRVFPTPSWCYSTSSGGLQFLVALSSLQIWSAI